MSLKPTTQERVERLVQEARWWHEDQSKPFAERVESLKKLEALIILVLKEQDRDTRYACADAVIQIKSTDALWTTQRAIDAAHAACMNAQAI